MAVTSFAPNPSPILDCSVLLVNDRPAALDAQWAILADQGYRLLHARGAAEAMEIFPRADDIATVVIDLADASGLALLKALRARGGDTVEYILICDRAAPDDGVQGSDVLARPADGARLTAAVSDAYNVARMQRFRLAEMQSLEESLAEFKAQTQAAMAQLIARAQNSRGARRGPARAFPDAPDAGLAAFITGELSRARLREKLFGAVALRHSGWMLLLVLGQAWSGGGELTIKSAAYSAGLPLSSALRTINQMCASGLITRRGDTLDARRSFIALTAQGRAQFARYAAAFAQAREQRA